MPYDDDLRLAHVLADAVERITMSRFRAHDLVVESKPDLSLVSDADKSVLVAYGAFGEKQLYGKTVTGVIRSTFVIDENGAIERALYNVKATGHVAKLRRDLGLD